MPTRRSLYCRPWIAEWRVAAPFQPRNFISESPEWRDCRNAIDKDLDQRFSAKAHGKRQAINKLWGARSNAPMRITMDDIDYTIRQCDCDQCRHGWGCAIAR